MFNSTSKYHKLYLAEVIRNIFENIIYSFHYER